MAQVFSSERAIPVRAPLSGHGLRRSDMTDHERNLAALQRQADHSPSTRHLLQLQALQRAEGDEEELLQGRFDPGVGLQRQSDDKDMLQPKSAGPGGLPAQLQQSMQSMSGVDLSGVQVHYNSAAPAQVGAHAFAQGSDIHLASGQERHLPHEAWHVVQQKQGRVQPTMDLGGVAINDSPALETEADRMGERARSGRPFP